MAKKVTAKEKPEIVVEGPEAAIGRPRLHILTVRNFRAIGSVGVTIEVDDIVVLVGPNNCGKSSILRAYQIVMQHGSKEGELQQDDFPNSCTDANNPVEIELETVVYEGKTPGEKWIRKDEKTGDMFVKEKWTWTIPGKPKKIGWNVEQNAWDADQQGPWGAPGVAQPGRPEPHRIQAFDSPEKQAESVIKLLKDLLNERIKGVQDADVALAEGNAGANEPTDYQKLLVSVSEFQKRIVAEADGEIKKVEKDLTDLIGRVFPGHVVQFDAGPEEDIENCLNFFKDTPQLLMGPKDGYKPSVEHQGSGARRTLLWAALRLLSEQARTKKEAVSARPHVLLIDEPELCLHPNAVREACKVLYDLPKTKTWQVMVTTHSPVFIDFWRDNTSIVRVERAGDGSATGTTIYRPQTASLDDDDRERLKLLNICDPYVAEFFFGGRTVLVEGDTEYTAFMYAVQKEPERFKDVHIVRARGKATICSLCKVLNQFGAPYAVLHDSDSPKTMRKNQEINNPAWTLNGKILAAVADRLAAGKVRLVASVPTFEPAYFGFEVTEEKPVHAWEHLRDTPAAYEIVAQLLDSLIDFGKPVPKNAIAWNSVDVLDVEYKKVTEAPAEPVAVVQQI